MNISIPESITHLTRIELDTIIGSRIRREDLVEIHIPGSVKTIGDNAFKGCQNLKRVTLEEGVEHIGTSAFCHTAIESITIPGSVKTIGDLALSMLYNLMHVTLEEGIQKIGTGAFYGTSIERIIIPKSVQVIGEQMLGGCLQLGTVILPEALAKNGCNSETLGVVSCVQIIVSDNLNQTVQEALNTYNSGIKAKENRLALQDMSQYSIDLLLIIRHLLINAHNACRITDQQKNVLANYVASTSCRDALNIAKQFPSIMHFGVHLKNSQKNIESLRSKMGNVLRRNKQALEICWGLIEDLHIKRVSLAWISPFLTLKEVARVILTMLSCKHGQAQIINSLEGQAVAAISIGVSNINAGMGQETESVSNNLVSSMGGGGVVQTGQENLGNTKLDEAAISDGKVVLG